MQFTTYIGSFELLPGKSQVELKASRLMIPVLIALLSQAGTLLAFNTRSA
ncbi:MAG: hypothetical protein GY726_06830 [Proteobacteria bacterium]|nr:hypothetical protein [Pseudomonadota bacterium]